MGEQGKVAVKVQVLLAGKLLPSVSVTEVLIVTVMVSGSTGNALTGTNLIWAELLGSKPHDPSAAVKAVPVSLGVTSKD